MSATAAWASGVAVAGGAALGGLGRWAVGVWLNARWPGFPLGTLFVNLSGGVLIGALLVWLDQRPDDEWRLFLLTGVLGGYTTFSAFSAESLALLQRGQWSLALGHTLAHVLGALVCAALGMALARSVAGS